MHFHLLSYSYDYGLVHWCISPSLFLVLNCSCHGYGYLLAGMRSIVTKVLPAANKIACIQQSMHMKKKEHSCFWLQEAIDRSLLNTSLRYWGVLRGFYLLHVITYHSEQSSSIPLGMWFVYRTRCMNEWRVHKYNSICIHMNNNNYIIIIIINEYDCIENWKLTFWHQQVVCICIYFAVRLSNDG